MGLMALVLVGGGFIGASVAYLQHYFARHDPEAGGALSVGAWFVGSAVLIIWLLVNPFGILAPSLALSAALSYLLTQELCDRRPASNSEKANDRSSAGDQLRAAKAPHSEP